MDREEWLARCAARYESLGGLTASQALEAAAVALDAYEEGDFTEDPEDAADADMECWDDDGDA